MNRLSAIVTVPWFIKAMIHSIPQTTDPNLSAFAAVTWTFLSIQVKATYTKAVIPFSEEQANTLDKIGQFFIS